MNERFGQVGIGIGLLIVALGFSLNSASEKKALTEKRKAAQHWKLSAPTRTVSSLGSTAVSVRPKPNLDSLPMTSGSPIVRGESNPPQKVGTGTAPAQTAPNAAKPSKEISAVQSFLRKRELLDADRKLREAQPIAKKSKQTKGLNGKFIGILEGLDGTRSKVLAEFQTSRDASGIDGKSLLSLPREGYVDQLAFEDGLRSLMDDSGKQATILRVSETEVLQLYYFKSAKLWIGNVYSSARTGRFELTGTTRLLKSRI